MPPSESASDSSRKELLVLPPPDSDREWYCIYTRPRHEKALARACRRENAPVFLPLTRRIRKYRSGRKERWLPLFRGYLFCLAGPEQRYDLSREQNLLSLLEVPGQEGLITELREIAKALEVSEELETVPYLKEGQRVEIKSGSFRGIVGVVERMGRDFKVYLNVHMVGRSVPLEIDAGSVEPVG